MRHVAHSIQPALPITLQACGEYVYLKIAKGLQVEKEKKDLVLKMREEIKLDIGAMRMQELRVERLRREYEFEVALTKHLNGKKARQETAPVASTEEKEALGRKEEAMDLCFIAWTNARARAVEILRVEKEIQTLGRVMDVWVEKSGDIADQLFLRLNGAPDNEGTPFQLAGLDCRCCNAQCEFPFVVDDLH